MQLGTRINLGTNLGTNINKDDLRRTQVSKGGQCLRGLAGGGGGAFPTPSSVVSKKRSANQSWSTTAKESAVSGAKVMSKSVVPLAAMSGCSSEAENLR